MTTAPSAVRRHMVAVVALVMALVACSGGGGEDGSGTGASAQDRVAAVREARQVVVEPAQALGTAAAEVAARLQALVAEPGPDTVTSVRSAVDDLDDAGADVDAVELDTATEDVASAAAALDDAGDAADDLATAASAVADAVEAATGAADRLAAVVAGWDERGSRSQLLARLDELQAETTEVADGLDRPERCAGPVEEVTAAATFVAEATGELRELVAQRDGLGFDARRAELDAAPYGTTAAGEPRRPGGPVATASCPAVDAAEEAAADVAAALRELQQALNPADLAS